jgi:hypothetical protein
MTIPYRQHWLLRRTERALRRSDPHMADMFAIFARVCAAEPIASGEQAGPPHIRARRCLTRLGGVITGIVGSLVACARWLMRCIASGYTVMRWRFSAGARARLGVPSASRHPMRGGGPGLPPL